MELEKHDLFASYDPGRLIDQIDGLPDQLQAAWELGQSLPLTVFGEIHQILITATGSTAAGADLLAAYAAPNAKVPVILLRDGDLPAWALGPHTLVVACAHGVDPTPTLLALEQAQARGCQVLAICLAICGAGAAEAAHKSGLPCWTFGHSDSAWYPRPACFSRPAWEAAGSFFGLLLALLARLDLILDPTPLVIAAVEDLRQQQSSLLASVPVDQNPAKRLAGQLCGREVTILGSGLMLPVARHWKAQFNLLSQVWAQAETVIEAAHSDLAGICQPEGILSQQITLFLRAPSDPPHSRKQSDLLRRRYMLEGLNTDFVNAAGRTPLSQMWTALHMGDYTAYYLAMAYGVDPAQGAQTVEDFNQETLRKV